MNQCIRCDKLVGEGAHTCVPSKQYLRGIVEGIDTAKHQINDALLDLQYHYAEKLKSEIK